MKVDENLFDYHDLQYEKHQCRFSGRAPFKNRTSQKILAILVKDKVKLLCSQYTHSFHRNTTKTLFFIKIRFMWLTYTGLLHRMTTESVETKIKLTSSLTKTDQKTLLCDKLTHLPRYCHKWWENVPLGHRRHMLQLVIFIHYSSCVTDQCCALTT